MKYLLIIRHAKTEQKGYDKDFERELTERGISDCEIMAERLSKIGFKPDLIQVSSAKRTKQTVKHLAKHLEWDKDKIFNNEKLYLASSNTILNELANTEKNINKLAVVGHNPGITDFFNSIGNASIDELPTCGMGLFKFDIKNWNDIITKKGQLEWYNWPKKED